MRRVLLIAVVPSVLLAALPMRSEPPQPLSAFTVRDDIALARFGHISVSPKGDMIVVQTEWASLQDGMVHETLRVYSLRAIGQAIRGPEPTGKIAPLWSFDRGTPSGDDSPESPRSNGCRTGQDSVSHCALIGTIVACTWPLLQQRRWSL